MPFTGGLGGSGWNPNGFTVQFTLKVIRQEDETSGAASPAPAVAAPKPSTSQTTEGGEVD